MTPRRSHCLTLAVLAALTAATVAQESGGIDPEALIERILAADQAQREQIHDVTCDAEYIERENKGDQGIIDKVRLVKKVYVKFSEDSTWFAEDYLEYYRDGERKSDDDLAKEAADRKEQRRRRNVPDISCSMLKPFYPGHRALYEIEYLGLADERIDDYVCHHFRVAAIKPADSLINGDFYVEAESFRLVRADFSPSRLVKKLTFRLKELRLSVSYGSTPDGYWLPRRFDIQGRGKKVFFFGVTFAGTEYYRNPTINTGLDNSIFEVENDR